MTVTACLQNRIIESARSRHLFNPGDLLIVALSGGADSVALLDLLGTLPGYRLRLVAAHLNHCLRGAESDGDEEFCRGLAAARSIPFVSRRLDVAELAAREGLNLEDAGRRMRIAFLDEVAARHGAAAVVLAHHADDQAETVLMRLLRGAGSHGLAGIAWKNRRGYVRPLLNVTRAEIEAYLQERGASWREDSSNQDTGLLRNRLRLDIIPALERCNPSLRKTLTATAAVLADEDSFLDELAEKAFTDLCEHADGHRATCSVTELLQQPPALARRIIRRMFHRVDNSRGQLTRQQVEAILAMAASVRPNLQFSLPGRIRAVREYNRLTLQNTADTPCYSGPLHIYGPGTYPLPDGTVLRVQEAPPPADLNSIPPESAWFDLRQTPFPWTVRTFSPGDRMQPLGMNGRKKVKDIFIERRIPPSRRAALPLFFSGAELFWIPGICTSHVSRIEAGTTSAVTAAILPAEHQ